jgi:hypothetical protein
MPSTGKRPQPLRTQAGIAPEDIQEPLQKVKRVPFLSLFFDHTRVTKDGIQNLKNARKLLEEVEERLNPLVRRNFRERLTEYVPPHLSLL